MEEFTEKDFGYEERELLQILEKSNNRKTNKPTVIFKNKEYDIDTIEEVHIFDLEDEELQEYYEVIDEIYDHYKCVETGETVWNGDDVFLKEKKCVLR